MNPLTLAELRLKHAQLTERAERLETEWRTLPVSTKSTALGKKIKALREQAADYGRLLSLAEGTAS
jgi:chaperonin cofactor prefoldin